MILCRHYGTKCGGCNDGISPNELVRKAKDQVYHLKCFVCITCQKQLSTGEELYILPDHKFLCKADYLNSKHKDGKISYFYKKLFGDLASDLAKLFWENRRCDSTFLLVFFPGG